MAVQLTDKFHLNLGGICHRFSQEIFPYSQNGKAKEQHSKHQDYPGRAILEIF